MGCLEWENFNFVGTRENIFMDKIAIFYGPLGGNTEKVANEIAQAFGESNCLLLPVKEDCLQYGIVSQWVFPELSGGLVDRHHRQEAPDQSQSPQNPTLLPRS